MLAHENENKSAPANVEQHARDRGKDRLTIPRRDPAGHEDDALIGRDPPGVAHGGGLLGKLLKAGWPEGVVLNVNFPDCQPDAVKGMIRKQWGEIKDASGKPLLATQ